MIETSQGHGELLLAQARAVHGGDESREVPADLKKWYVFIIL